MRLNTISFVARGGFSVIVPTDILSAAYPPPPFYGPLAEIEMFVIKIAVFRSNSMPTASGATDRTTGYRHASHQRCLHHEAADIGNGADRTWLAAHQ
jgi:hypothetical protein